MQFISVHDGKLQKLQAAGLKLSPTRAFATGLSALDALAPRQSFARGAIHELLFDPSREEPKFVAALLARSASSSFNIGCSMFDVRCSSFQIAEHRTSNIQHRTSNEMRPLIWADPHGEVYPPALAALGFDLSKLYLLHPKNLADEAWAVAECLRCRGVGAVIASPPSMSRLGARRLQLAAERGQTVGILLRPRGRNDTIYAAATRWLVAPHPGERMTQRWTIQLLHGHGGRVGQSVFLEWNRETNTVHSTEKLPDRSVAPAARTRAIA